MNINSLKLNELPQRLRDIHTAPKQLFVSGAPLEELLMRKSVAIVGSRKLSPYGRQVTYDLAGRLAEQGVVIVSGLALGVDAVAHQAALDAGGLTIAVLPSPLEAVYPAGHRRLAQAILDNGGAIVSEFARGAPMHRGNFIARNRIVSGLGDALLITEAAEKSGTLHTARFALEQGRDVLAVPGNITSETSAGTNSLIKAGAAPVTSYQDILYVLGIHPHATTISQVYGRNAEEQTLLDLLITGLSDGEALQKASKLDIASFNQTLTMLEISGKIRPLGANHWALA